DEVVPVAHLVDEVAPLGLAGVGPEDALVPVAVAAQQLADGAVVDLLHRLPVAGLGAALGAGDDGEGLLLGLLVGVEDLSDAGRVGADRLLGEDVLAGRHAGLEVDRPEAGRGGEDDVVDVGLEQLLEGVQAREAATADVHAVAQLLDLVLVLEALQPAAAALEAAAEGVGPGADLDVLGLV